MSKSIAEIARHPARFAALAALVIAVAMLALFAARMDTQAGHKDDFELDVHTGTVGTCTATFASGLCDDANTATGFTDGAGSFDWVDVCTTYDDLGVTPPTGKFGKDITQESEAALAALGVSTAACVDDYHVGGASIVTGGDHTYFDQDKDIHDISGTPDAWGCVSQSTPTPKDEILNASAIVHTAASGVVAGDTILYYNLERGSNNGTAFNGVWFMQAGASCFNNTNAKVSFSGGPHVSACKDGTLVPCPGATTERRGDILVLSNYTGGGRIAGVKVGEWSVGGATDPCPFGTRADTNICQIAISGDCANEEPPASPGTGVPATDVACAVVNTRVFKVTPGAGELPLAPWNNECVAKGSNKCISGTRVDLGTNQFFEGSLDLTQLLCVSGGVPVPGCEIPCFSTFLAETRSSAQFDATLKDYARGVFVTCTTALQVRKENEDGDLLTGACFEITPDPFDDTGPLTVCDDGVDANDKADGADGFVCIEGIAPGTYTVHESVAPSGHIGDPIDKVVDTKLRDGDPLSVNIDCADLAAEPPDAVFVNSLGSLAWEKRSDIDGSLQGGASFSISPNPFACHQPPGADPGTFFDNAPPDADPDDGQYLIEDVCLGSYTITEESAPTNFAIDPDDERTCDVTAANPDCVVGTQGDADDCPDTTGTPDDDGGPAGTDTGSDFCNPVGKLRFLKNAKDASAEGGESPFCCATFHITDTGTGGTVVDITVTDNSLPDADAAGGSICINNIPLNVEVTIEETATNNPAYLPDPNPTRTATIAVSSTCEGDSSVDVADDFDNIPLSEIEVIFRSLAGDGITQLTTPIVCDSIADTDADSAGPTFDDPVLDRDEVFTDLEPGTYTCTIVIDP